MDEALVYPLINSLQKNGVNFVLMPEVRSWTPCTLDVGFGRQNFSVKGKTLVERADKAAQEIVSKREYLINEFYHLGEETKLADFKDLLDYLTFTQVYSSNYFETVQLTTPSRLSEYLQLFDISCKDIWVISSFSCDGVRLRFPVLNLTVTQPNYTLCFLSAACIIYQGYTSGFWKDERYGIKYLRKEK